MRIVQVTDTLQPGGAERVAVDLSNLLLSRGHEVYFCTTRTEGPLISELSSGIPITCLHRTTTFSGLLRFREFVKKNNFNVVHAHGNSSARFCIISLAGLSSVNIIHHDHNPVLTKRSPFMERFILGRANRWIVVSELIYKWVLDKVKYKNPQLILNPINTGRFQPASHNLKDPVRIVSLSNYRIEKNYENLLASARLVLEEGMPVEFFCYGSHHESEYFNRIKSLRNEYGLQKIVHLNPPTMDVPSILQSADMGVLFSSFEGLPISLLEYMASSLPVVVTDVGNCGAIVGSAGCGEVVPSNDPAAFVRALGKIINAPNRRQLGDQGRQYVDKHHSLEAFGSIVLEEVYNAV